MEDACRHYECYSDEHYMPVLLAFKGLENKTDCVGSLTNVDWSVSTQACNVMAFTQDCGCFPIQYHHHADIAGTAYGVGATSLDQTGCALISGALGFRSENKPHPWSYTPEEVNAATIRRLRAKDGCYPAAALR